MTYSDIQSLITEWNLSSAFKAIQASTELSDEQRDSLNGMLREFEDCENKLVTAEQISAEDGFHSLQQYPNQALLKSHPRYLSVIEKKSNELREKIQNLIAQSSQDMMGLSFRNAELLLEDAERLSAILKDPEIIKQVQECNEKLKREKVAQDLVEQINNALEEGHPGKGFDLLHQLESLGIKDDKTIQGITKQLSDDETHRMGQSTKKRAPTEYGNILNVRRSLDASASTNYRLRYNAEVRYIALAEARKDYLQKDLSSLSNDDPLWAANMKEIEDISNELVKARKNRDEYYQFAINGVKEKVEDSIKSAEYYLQKGNYIQASKSLNTARLAGKPDEIFAGFVHDVLNEVDIDVKFLKKIEEIEQELAVKKEERAKAEEAVDRIKNLLFQNDVDSAAISRARHDLDQIKEKEPNLPGLQLISKKVDDKIDSINTRQKILLEIEINESASQWNFENARKKLGELKQICPSDRWQNLENSIKIQEQNQYSAKLLNAEFERTFQDMLDTVEVQGIDNLKKILDDWQKFADRCEVEFLKVLNNRRALNNFIQKQPELLNNKTILNEVLVDKKLPDNETNVEAYNLASSIIKSQPSIVSLLANYWIKAAELIPDNELERKLKTLQNGVNVAEYAEDKRVLSLVNSKIKKIQNKTEEGKYANQLLDRVTPLLTGENPNITEAGRILSEIPQDHPVREYFSIKELINKKEKLSIRQIAKIKFSQIQGFLNDYDNLGQVLSTLNELLEKDPDNFEYQRYLIQTQSKIDADKKLEDNLDKYIEDIKVVLLDEIDVFLKGISGNQSFSLQVKNKIEKLRNKYDKTWEDLKERLRTLKSRIDTFVEVGQLEDARNELEKIDFKDLHSSQYIELGNLKYAVQNKIDKIKIVDEKIKEAHEKAKQAKFAEALRSLTGLENWPELPDKKKVDVNAITQKFISCEEKYRQSSADLDDFSEMMQDLRISIFGLQKDIATKILDRSDDDHEKAEKIQRIYRELMSIEPALPEGDEVLMSYKSISSVLHSIDEIEQSSPVRIPGDRVKRNEELKMLKVNVDSIDKEIKQFPKKISHLQSHRHTRSMLIKCQENRTFREIAYRIEDDLEQKNFLAYLSGIWSKHLQSLEGLETLYHFKLEGVDA